MDRAIVVGAWHGNADALWRLLASLHGTQWPVMIVVSGSDSSPKEFVSRLLSECSGRPRWEIYSNAEDRYELGAFSVILAQTEVDEFLFLQDTFEWKQIGLIDAIMAHDGPVALGPAMFHYAGKWRREILDKMIIPTVTNKKDSVHYEHAFSHEYLRHETKPLWVVDQHFHDGEHKGFVQAYGRKNMVLENDWYRKLKADWGQRPL